MILSDKMFEQSFFKVEGTVSWDFAILLKGIVI